MSLKNIVNQGVDIVEDLYDDIRELFFGSNSGEAGVLASSVETPDQKTNATVQELFDEGRPTDQELTEINVALQEKRISDAAKLVSPKSSLSKGDIEGILSVLQPTLKGTIVLDDSYSAIPDPFIIGANNTLWSGSETTPDLFTTISSVEELESEFMTIERPITELVVHWTESYSNANLNAGQIHDRHNQLGHDGLVYHYLIRRDGTLQRGRPVEKRSGHIAGHEAFSIAIAFVGGYNTETQETNFENNTGIRSLNRSQFNTFDEILRVFYAKYPAGQVFGHNDLEEDAEDPGFDVIEYAFNKFGKCVKYENPFEQNSLSPSDLNDY